MGVCGGGSVVLPQWSIVSVHWPEHVVYLMEKDNPVFLSLKNEEFRTLVLIAAQQKWKRESACMD